MRFKRNTRKHIRFYRMHPAIVGAIDIIDDVFEEVAGCESLCTSGNDHKHRAGSRHYDTSDPEGRARALDLRTKWMGLTTVEKKLIRDLLKAKLGPNFRVILEKLGRVQEHIHLSYIGP